MSVSPSGGHRRYLAWRFGRMGEALCAWQLRLAGYRIIGRDVRTPVGEIDLIARRGGTLAFIEVKARRQTSEEVLTLRQRRRIIRAAEMFLARRPELGTLAVRFDVMLIGRRRWPRHLAAAFRADD